MYSKNFQNVHDNFSLTDIETFVNNTYGDIQQSLAPLTPLADTMKKALVSIGIKPPDNIQDIAALFNQHIAAPSGQSSGNAADTILAYFTAAIKAKNAGQNLSNTQNIVANGGLSLIDELEAEITTGQIFKNPFFWVALVGLMLTLYIAFRK